MVAEIRQLTGGTGSNPATLALLGMHFSADEAVGAANRAETSQVREVRILSDQVLSKKGQKEGTPVYGKTGELGKAGDTLAAKEGSIGYHDPW